jgi:CDP-glucose 4,6-dehydratase
MKSLENLKLFSGIYSGKKVFITGHTGFKGSWLAYWVKMLGAEVYGYALEPHTTPNHFALNENVFTRSYIGDVRDQQKLQNAISESKPDIIFHLGAQALVRTSYLEPVNNFETNIMGTLKLFEAVKQCPSVRAMIIVTTDKVYENQEWSWGYRENDRLGGLDPYSASKAMVELLTTSYRHSYFNHSEFGKTHKVLIATARAGNVMGGGDWAEDRLIPDLMKNASKNQETIIRNKYSTRPWQHVLEALSGYLLLGEKLLAGETDFAKAYNFAQSRELELTVEEVSYKVIPLWNNVKIKFGSLPHQPHEAGLLKLDCSLARKELDWVSILSIDEALDLTVSWYKNYYDKNLVKTEEDIIKYVALAHEKKTIWAKH